MMLIISILGFIVIILAAFVVYQFCLYKWTVIIRVVTADRKIIKMDKARVTLQEGVEHLYLRGEKKLLVMPPIESVEITKRGKPFCEVWKQEEGNYTYLEDTRKVKGSFQPLTTNQRLTLINQIRKAHARKKSTFSDLVIPVAGVSALVMIVFALFIFWGDLAKPILESGEQQLATQKEITKSMSMLQEVIQKKQIILSNEKGDEPPP